MKDTVDVIIPAFNSLTWIEQTIDSVLSQTHKDIMVYIIDDGSTDGTEILVRSLRDKRVKYYKKKNGGVSSARNYGIDISNSPFIAFLDSDDLWMPDKLEKQLELLKSDSSLGMVYGSHYIIDDNNIIQRNNIAHGSGWLFGELVKGNCITGSASMVLTKSEVLEKAGLFREDLINGEDWELWMRISKISTIDFVPDILASIRVHKASAQQSTEKMSDALLYAFNVIKNEFELTTTESRLLASYCLFNSAVSYYHIKNYSKARGTLWRLFKENPVCLRDFDNWKIHFGLGIFSKIAFSYSVFRKLSDLIALPFKALKRLIKFLLRFVWRILKIRKIR
jgi:glycosyltransferase involved in cell wall biosynthesis